jgi:Zn finger protein HypA/HybF involved in hydrogenase expression
MFPTAASDHADIRCPRCGSSWFRIVGFAAVSIHYDAERRSFLNDVLIDESITVLPCGVRCMDCDEDCSTAVRDILGPLYGRPAAATSAES